MTSSNHLISNGYEDIESLVDSLPDPPVRTALVKFSKLGPFKLINVELNDQVHQLFEGITIKSDIVGFRLGWYQLVFFDLGNYWSRSNSTSTGFLHGVPAGQDR